MKLGQLLRVTFETYKLIQSARSSRGWNETDANSTNELALVLHVHSPVSLNIVLESLLLCRITT